jgi:hypothetical protein
MKKYILILTVNIFLFFVFIGKAQINLKEFKVLPLSDVEPAGWLKKQILRDMKQGYFSVITELQPTLRHEVFGPVNLQIIQLIRMEIIP